MGFILLYCASLCDDIFLHSVLTLAEEETYFPFPATDTYLFTFLDLSAAQRFNRRRYRLPRISQGRGDAVNAEKGRARHTCSLGGGTAAVWRFLIAGYCDVH